MKRILSNCWLCLSAVGLLAACSDDAEAWTQHYELAWRYDTEAQFSVGKSALFTDLSIGVATREWSFEDATPATSTLPEPTVVFNAMGKKRITLTVNFLNGTSDSASFEVEVFYPLTAEIAPQPLTPMGCLRTDEPIRFALDRVEGAPTSYAWSFEGGTPATSTEENPEVVWNAPNARGAKVTCKLTRADDGMTATVEQTYIVGNYPLLHALPDLDYDPWSFELSSFGKWTLWNTAVGQDDVQANASIAGSGADGTAHAVSVVLQPNVIYQFFTRDNWVCNARLEPGRRYEVSFWQKSDAPAGTLVVLLGIYNYLPSWSWNEYLGTLAGDHWSQWLPDIPFEEQEEELLAIWSNIDYPISEEITLPATESLMPGSEWRQVRLEFTAAGSRYAALLNSYPQFALLSVAGEAVWQMDEMQINLIED